LVAYNVVMNIHIKRSHIGTAVLMGIALIYSNRFKIRKTVRMYRTWAGEILLGIDSETQYDEGYEDGFDDGLMERHSHTQAREECAGAED
jgi:hypothetical protein